MIRFYLGSRDVWTAAIWMTVLVAAIIGLAAQLPRSQPEPTRHGECPCVGCPISPEEGQSCESR